MSKNKDYDHLYKLVLIGDTSVGNAYYRGADGIIVVYDVTNEESFKHINEWFLEVNRYASENCCKIIVGNKVDLPNKVIPTETAKAYADKLNMPFIETSAVTAANVDTAFETITRQLMESRGALKGAGAAGTTSPRASLDKDVKKLEKLGPDAKGKKSSCC
eukprot:gene9416-10403_t